MTICRATFKSDGRFGCLKCDTSWAADAIPVRLPCGVKSERGFPANRELPALPETVTPSCADNEGEQQRIMFKLQDAMRSEGQIVSTHRGSDSKATYTNFLLPGGRMLTVAVIVAGPEQKIS